MKKEDRKFQQIVLVKNKFEHFIYLPDELISVFDENITNKTISNAL